MAKRKEKRAEARVYLSGQRFEDARKAFTRMPGFPRAFYAFALTHGFTHLEGDDGMGDMLGASGANIRARVVELWQKAGHVVVEYEGRMRLAVIVENA